MLKRIVAALLRVTSTTCAHYPDGQPNGGCYWCGNYPFTCHA